MGLAQHCHRVAGAFGAPVDASQRQIGIDLVGRQHHGALQIGLGAGLVAQPCPGHTTAEERIGVAGTAGQDNVELGDAIGKAAGFKQHHGIDITSLIVVRRQFQMRPAKAQRGLPIACLIAANRLAEVIRGHVGCGLHGRYYAAPGRARQGKAAPRPLIS